LSTEPVAGKSESDCRVVGLGTLFNSDDRIGLALVQALSREPAFAARCVLFENADAAAVASCLIEWNQSAILVDAADMGLDPGKRRFFSDRECSMVLKSDPVSTHGLGLAEGLELARALGFDQSVRIFGIQPYDVSPGETLTAEMGRCFVSLLADLKSVCSRPLK
jgi:hydrogenase maturation protease